jgi:glycerophosphoryl diester phosphodiesterase
MNLLKTCMAVVCFLCLYLSGAAQNPASNSGCLVDSALAHNRVIISSHRCSWRTAPENSVQALNDCAALGADIAEFDLKYTKDNQIVIMHDNTIDRTTTGKGRPSTYTLDEIRRFNLKAATGHPTRHIIPTLEEMLSAAKGKIIVNIDKGYDCFDDALPLIRKMDMTGQVIYNIPDNLPYDSVVARHGEIDPQLWLMIVVDPSSPKTDNIVNGYLRHPRTIIQTVYASDTVRILSRIPEIRKHFPVWFNALWPEHSAGHDDDIAVEENKPDETWGWLISRGATILQTDRPGELARYLKVRGLHR